MFFGTVSMHAQCTVTVSGTTVKMSNGTLSAEISGQVYVKKLNLGGINLLTSNGIYYDYTTTDGRRLNFTKAQLVRKSDDLWRCSSLTTPPISAAARASSCAVVSVTSTSMSSSKAYRHRATFT